MARASCAQFRAQDAACGSLASANRPLPLACLLMSHASIACVGVWACAQCTLQPGHEPSQVWQTSCPHLLAEPWGTLSSSLWSSKTGSFLEPGYACMPEGPEIGRRSCYIRHGTTLAVFLTTMLNINNSVHCRWLAGRQLNSCLRQVAHIVTA